MDLVSSLSPSLWDLLQRTRLRADVALELFDEHLNPLLPASDDPRTRVLRRATTVKFFAGTELSFRTVRQSGREARMAIDEWELTLLPVRCDEQPVGLLAALTPRASEATPEWVAPGPGEAAARAWRDAIESDLCATRRFRAQEHLTHRSRALATFIADMQYSTDEAQLLSALLQAMAVWHDVEPCAYARDLAGHFGLRATLPGTDVSLLSASLDAGAVIEATARNSRDWPVLMPLGRRARGTLLMLVRSGSLEEWLIAITGNHDADLNEQLQPILRGFSAAMERVREREARQLRQQLWDAMVASSDRTDHAELGREVLNIVARGVEATQGLLSVAQDTEPPGSPSALMPVQTENMHLLRDGPFTADALRLTFPLGSGRAGFMEFRRSDGGWFRPQDATTLLAVRPLILAWLLGMREAGEWSSSVGLQESSRVLRFTESSASAVR